MGEDNVTGVGLTESLVETDATLKLCIIAAMCVLIILGNTAVILVISSSVSGWSRNSRLVLISLTGADAALALVIIPLNLYVNSVRQLRNQTDSPFCHTVVFLDASILTSSIYSLATISIERYIAVFFPLRYGRLMTPRRIKALIALVWLLPPILLFPISIPRGIVKVYFSGASLICNLEFSSNATYTLLLTAFIFFPCSLIITFANCRLWCAARSQRNRFKPSKVNRRDAASRVLLPVVVVYYICWSPCVCTMIYQALTHQSVPDWMEFVALWLPCGNGFFNCIVYFWLNKSFRKKFQEMGRKLCCSKYFVVQNTRISQVPQRKIVKGIWKYRRENTARVCSISSTSDLVLSSN
ncbi:melatonin receptor type 1A-like [Hypanus sabinus]|uniref:melatonin receptor type 1A-like n=1 Tax=Hypanus sabinus TaxID=79690 RepID=UPI0028C4917A|nr:melatonin receptor type 1A-like [Hypanus sabinus]